jgi:hypothetical protein
MQNIIIYVGIVLFIYICYYLDINASSVCQINIKTFIYLAIIFVFVLFILRWLRSKNAKWIEGMKALAAREIYTNGMFGSADGPWDPDVVQKFINFQYTRNTNVVFDMTIIQQQATQKEAEEYLKNGEWTWSKETENLYLEQISQNNYIKIPGKKSLSEVKRIYNEKAILQFLTMHEAEGDFLINGVYVPSDDDTNTNTNSNPNPTPNSGFGTFGVNSGLEPDKKKDIVGCGLSSTNANATPVLQRISGDPKKKNSFVDFNILPDIIKGFTFHNKPCNPCVALKFPPDYSCAFSLDNKKNSPVWESVWGLTPSSTDERQNDIKRIHDNDYIHAVTGWF